MTDMQSSDQAITNDGSNQTDVLAMVIYALIAAVIAKVVTMAAARSATSGN